MHYILDIIHVMIKSEVTVKEIITYIKANDVRNSYFTVQMIYTLVSFHVIP